ncbi:GYD domain-containing protein [Deltaproteobacteria bacterium IMCC39524]|nr:GYD domain-containing protein [Deltaproteobacteria bacterium IMCC39524]
MATFVTLINFTDQGIRNVKDSPARLEAFRALVEAQGGTVKSAYWTLGNYDLVVTVEGTEEAAMTTSLTVGSLGNVRTQTLRGFSADEMKSFISKMP